MRLRNLLIVAATLFGFSAIVNADTVTNNNEGVIGQSQTQVSDNATDFNLGFTSSTNVLLKKIVIKNKASSGFSLGFNSSPNSPVKQEIATEQLVNAKVEPSKSDKKVNSNFNIGFNS